MVYMASVFVGQSIRGALMGSRRLMMVMMTLPLALGKLPSIEGGYPYIIIPCRQVSKFYSPPNPQ